MLSLFKRRSSPAIPALHDAVVAASRAESFYLSAGVPDTLDGRFGLLAVHAFLVMRNLRGRADNLAQLLFDRIFSQLDLNLRELGVGDMGVGKRVRVMGEAFYGSLSAYEAALKQGDEALYKALCNNLYGTLPEAPTRATVQPVIDYIKRNADLPLADLMNGKVEFNHV